MSQLALQAVAPQGLVAPRVYNEQQYRLQPQLVAQGVTLYLTTTVGFYNALYYPGQYLYFQSPRDAFNYVAAVPQCLATDYQAPYPFGSLVTVSQGYGCYNPQPVPYPQPSPYCPCANNNNYY